MSEQGGRGAVVNAVVNGVVTGIWYSLPDAVSSRPARGWLKVAVLVGGSLFPILGGLHHWMPKLTGWSMQNDMPVTKRGKDTVPATMTVLLPPLQER